MTEKPSEAFRWLLTAVFFIFWVSAVWEVHILRGQLDAARIQLKHQAELMNLAADAINRSTDAIRCAQAEANRMPVKVPHR